MIPKKIHYIWFGGNPLPPLAIKCIKSWEKHCRGYEIIRWDESNFDISSCPDYVKEAYENKKWAFVTDYVRLKIVYDNGGIYFDTDVEAVKKMDRFLNASAFFGFEAEERVATGLGFGAEKGNELLKAMMDDYEGVHFVLPDGSFDLTPCPQRNTEVFKRLGLVPNGKKQTLDGGAEIYPIEYFCPMDFVTGEVNKTKNTHTIHHFCASWQSDEEKKYHEARRRYLRREKYLRLPKKILTKLLGKERFEAIKKKIKRG